MEEASQTKKGFFNRLFSKNKDISEEELISMVNSSTENGMINSNEALMIQNIFEFGDKDAKDIMTHRVDIVGIDGQLKLKYIVDFINEQNFSRYPVFLEDLDNIIGLIHIKDVLKFSVDQDAMEKSVKDIDDLIRPCTFIPETHSINSIFTKMQSEKNHMAIVVDEYGQTSGIISMEDILEEIVGEIEDENDLEDDSIQVVTPNRFNIDGLTPIDEVEELLGINIEGDFETLNGFLISQYGKVPEDGSSFVIKSHGCQFRVVNVEGHTIQNVRVVKLATDI